MIIQNMKYVGKIINKLHIVIELYQVIQKCGFKKIRLNITNLLSKSWHVEWWLVKAVSYGQNIYFDGLFSTKHLRLKEYREKLLAHTFYILGVSGTQLISSCMKTSTGAVCI